MPTQFKEERKICYNARDKFWQCLDLNNDDAEKCKVLRKEFVKSCSLQWVNHFDRKRKYDQFKKYADEVNWQELPQEKKPSSSV